MLTKDKCPTCGAVTHQKSKSIASCVEEYFYDNPEEELWAQDIADKWGFAPKGITQALAGSVAEGRLSVYRKQIRNSRFNVYSKGKNLV